MNLPSRRHSRDDEINYTLCLLCQTRTKQKLRNASEAGMSRIKQALSDRLKYNDVQNVLIMDRLQTVDLEGDFSNIRWHDHCYGPFTHSEHIKRLKARYESRLCRQSNPQPSSSANYSQCVERSSRSTSNPVFWTKCMFCQMDKKEKLHNVETLSTSTKILKLGLKDHTMRVRLAGVTDLVADGGKYHLKCYRKFVRDNETSGGEDECVTPATACFQNVVDELRVGLARGGVYKLSSVWQRYCELLAELDIDPGPYRSNRFKEKLQQVAGNEADFIAPLDRNESMLVFPSGSSIENLRMTLKNVDQGGDSLMLETSNVAADMDAELLSWLYRVAVKILADIRDAPEFNIVGGIDVAHAEKVVPESLYLFLRLLCCGDDLDDVESDGDAKHIKVLNTAQDVVFLACKGRRTTPKHLGLGLTVHQATRSKDLVQLLHAAGNSVSYETVLRSDTSIADDMISR